MKSIGALVPFLLIAAVAPALAEGHHDRGP